MRSMNTYRNLTNLLALALLLAGLAAGTYAIVSATNGLAETLKDQHAARSQTWSPTGQDTGRDAAAPDAGAER